MSKTLKSDSQRIKDEIKNDLKQLKADKKAREKEEKARAKQKGSAYPSPSALSPKAPNAPSQSNGQLFGKHFSSSGFQNNALSFARTCFAWIEDADSGHIEERGIYRVSGAQSEVHHLRSQFDANPNFALSSSHDVNSVTGVLKLFFREMPEPLIPYSLYESVLAAVEISDDTRVSTLRGLFSLLPTVNRHLFAALMDHLHEVAKYAQTNLMDANNLAIVFAPNLLRPEDDSPENVLADAMCATELVALLIGKPALFLSDSKFGHSSAPTTSNEPEQRDVYDEMAEMLDPLQLAYYLQYYVAQGCDQSSAKKWAVYYLWEAQKEQLRQQQQMTSATTQTDGSRQQPSTPQRAALKRATTEGDSMSTSRSWSARNTVDESDAAPFVPAVTLTKVDEDDSRDDKRRTVDDTWAAPVSPRGPGAMANSRVAIGRQNRRAASGGEALPTASSDPSLLQSAASTSSGGPPKRAPPVPQARNTISATSSATTSPTATPDASPRISPRNTSEQSHSPSKPPVPPRRPIAPLPASNPPAHAPPAAPKVESVARERLSSRQRNRGMSIVQMRKNFDGSEEDYQRKMQQMLENYRSGAATLDTLKS